MRLFIKYPAGSYVFLVAAVIYGFQTSSASYGETSRFPVTTIEVRNDTVLTPAKRLGLNVGYRDPFGASQILKNFIDNPGFEAGHFATVFHTDTGSSGARIYQAFWNTAWNNNELNIGQPAGFWNGADYEFVYGPAKGRAGTVVTFDHASGRYRWQLDTTSPNPNVWDVVFARMSLPGLARGSAMNTALADTSTTRPGSPGKQSLHLRYTNPPANPVFAYYFDSAWRDGDPTAGKLYIVKGNYRLSFWAKGLNSSSQLEVQFRREGEAIFLNQVILLTTTWQEYVFDFYVPPGTDPIRSYSVSEYHPILGLEFFIPRSNDQVWLDDLALYSRDDQNPTVFTDAFVNRLKELKPGVLRDWGNQLGADLESQLAPPFARTTQGFKPSQRVAGEFSYSLHEFLELCEEVGAEPWYVIPPTFTSDEMLGLAEYLAGPADGAHPYADKRAALGKTEPWTSVFPVIHLEYGNEMWGGASGNDPFWGASALGGVRLGKITHDRFGIFRSSPFYNPTRFNLIIGGQVGFPARQDEIERNSSNHNTIALAPYFGSLAQHANDAEIYYPLFAAPFHEAADGYVKQAVDYVRNVGQGTDIAIYEINFHTTDGVIPLTLRNDFVTGAGGAIALPLSMLVYQRELGARTQCAFTALQYSWQMTDGDYVRLWGLLRDLYTTARKRPGWLGLELVNRVIRGNMLQTVQAGANPSWVQQPMNGIDAPVQVSYVQSFAFGSHPDYGCVLFNLSLTDTQTVQLTAPTAVTQNAVMYRITPANIHDNNETSENVVLETIPISDFSNPYTFDMPPHAVYGLVWAADSGPPPQSDHDGDGVPDAQDAFPNNPREWADADADGLGDNFEQLIIDAAQNDNEPTNDYINSLEMVLPQDDFDNDGYTNLDEFILGSDPTQVTVLAVSSGLVLLSLALFYVIAYSLDRRKQCIRPQ
ncbi:MAG TPA: hypothetical protein PKY35_04190 [Candidatus Hydrogenedentes bacterium]|nr:hypothetical protein [Candidatus Hydrogenedentota bacterium]HOL76206.1 hypothetical protein [Candidatus Hydrogenedentota bacterium]HPO86491.1 hypothetical protein [Candidatus Hydrogenedentota bacterium]